MPKYQLDETLDPKISTDCKSCHIPHREQDKIEASLDYEYE